MQESSLKLPVFDVSQPLDPSSLSSLSTACREWGFFHITNHGVSKDLYKKLREVSTHFFSLPYQTKIKIGPFSKIRSYTPHFIASPFFESLRVSGPDYFASANGSFQVLFDHPDSEFSRVLMEYGEKMTELSKKIVKAVLASLGEGLEEKFYETEFGNCHGYFRINNYSSPHKEQEEQKQRRELKRGKKERQEQEQKQIKRRKQNREPQTPKQRQEQKQRQKESQEQEGRQKQSQEHEEQDRQLEEESMEGLGMHTDMSCVTIVSQDEIGGLQVRSRDGKWLDINPNGETLVVNIGDLLHAWSNGRLRSSQHRVVLKKRRRCSFVIGRLSVAFFWCFEEDKVIFAPNEIAGSDGQVRAFKPFTCRDYVRFRESSEKGRFDKIGYTVTDFAGIEAEIT